MLFFSNASLFSHTQKIHKNKGVTQEHLHFRCESQQRALNLLPYLFQLIQDSIEATV